MPTMRRRGIGSSLLVSCCDFVRARGAHLIEINVDGEDVDARRFYERHGFSCVRRHQLGPDPYYSRELP